MPAIPNQIDHRRAYYALMRSRFGVNQLPMQAPAAQTAVPAQTEDKPTLAQILGLSQITPVEQPVVAPLPPLQQPLEDEATLPPVAPRTEPRQERRRQKPLL